MVRFATCVTIAATLAGAGLAFAGAEPAASEDADALIIQAKDHAELTKKFCAANPNVEHIVVLPASLFVDSEQMICGNGPYKLYRIIEATDTDDFEYFLDPPATRAAIVWAATEKPAAPCRPSRSTAAH
jgi:hypothetical protein